MASVGSGPTIPVVERLRNYTLERNTKSTNLTYHATSLAKKLPHTWIWFLATYEVAPSNSNCLFLLAFQNHRKYSAKIPSHLDTAEW